MRMRQVLTLTSIEPWSVIKKIPLRECLSVCERCDELSDDADKLQTQQWLALKWLELRQETPAPAAEEQSQQSIYLDPAAEEQSQQWLADNAHWYERQLLVEALGHVRRHSVSFTDQGTGKCYHALVPLLSSVPHIRGAESGSVHWSFDSETREVIITAGPSGADPGVQLSRCFGDVCNDKLLQLHGVADIGNPYQTVTLDGSQCGAKVQVTLFRCAAVHGPQYHGIPGETTDLASMMALRRQSRKILQAPSIEEVPPTAVAQTTATSGEAGGGDASRACLEPVEKELEVWGRLLHIIQHHQHLQIKPFDPPNSRWGADPARLVEEDRRLLLQEAKEKLLYCIEASNSFGRLVFEAPPPATRPSALDPGIWEELPLPRGLTMEFRKEARRMPSLVRQLLVHHAPPESVAPMALLRSLRLPKDSFMAVKAAMGEPRLITIYGRITLDSTPYAGRHGGAPGVRCVPTTRPSQRCGLRCTALGGRIGSNNTS